MKRRIHIELLVTSGLAILLTLTFAMFVFYGLFRSQIIRDLETDARVMKNMGVFDDISRMAEKNGSISSEDLRITVVSPEETSCLTAAPMRRSWKTMRTGLRSGRLWKQGREAAAGAQRPWTRTCFIMPSVWKTETS